jgi:hypothetical protein
MIRRTILPIVAAFFLVACASCGTDNPPNNQDDCDGGDCNVIQIESCDGPSDCPIGKSCREGKCVSADAQCETDEDCGPDRRCEDGICFAKEREIRPIPDMTTADMGDDSGGSNVCNGCYLPTSGGGADAGDAGDAGTDMGADAGMGECVEGNTKEACGGGGAVCITCPGEQLCDEGTCVDPPTCDETNCDGCCNGSECLEGNTDDACGTGGMACETCSSPAVCDADTNSCVVPCNEDTCSGCCTADGECVDGEAIDACGTGGMNCMECNPADQNCSQGACVDKGCSETCDGCCDGDACLSGDLDGACGWFGVACITCDTGMTCEFGNCVVDANSRWDVEIVSAAVPDKNANGDDWDSFGGLPDPFVRFKTEDSGMTWDETTETKDDTTYPFYFETIVTDVPARALMDRWDIWVEDSDTFGSPVMGSCYGDFVQADFDGSTFPVTCPAHGDQVEVTVRLRLLPH